MTPAEWYAYQRGWKLREKDEWYRTRALYTLIYNSNVLPSSQISNPEDLIPLEEKQEQEEPETKKLNIEQAFDIAKKYNLNI